MEKLKYLLLLLLVSGLFACSKENDDDLSLAVDTYSDTPVFTFTANSGEYSIQAGVNDFYMFTEYSLDSLERLSFTGRFAKLSTCLVDCAEELSFKLSLSEPISDPNSILISEFLSTETFQFNDASTSIQPVNVLIEYRSRDSITYRSDLIENLESTFELLSIEDYNKNENNNPTKILTISFDVELKSIESEDIILFENAEAIIAIAYPG